MAVELNCPSCQSLLATYSHEFKLHNREYLTRDGDAIPATPSDADGKAALAMAAVGVCSTCRLPYWFVEYVLYPGTAAELYEFLGEGDLPNEWHEVSAPEVSEPWLYQDVEVDTGLVQFHQIGPFALPEGTTPFTRQGVSACRVRRGPSGFWAVAAGQACAAWPAVTAMARADNPRALGRPTW